MAKQTPLLLYQNSSITIQVTELQIAKSTRFHVAYKAKGSRTFDTITKDEPLKQKKAFDLFFKLVKEARKGTVTFKPKTK